MSRRSTSLRAAAVGIALTALALAGCASGGTAGGDASAPADDGYITPGKLTIATGEPAYFPYVIDDDPSSGEGFEAAIAYAVAEELVPHVDSLLTAIDAAVANDPTFQQKLDESAHHMTMTAAILTGGIVANKKITD